MYISRLLAVGSAAIAFAAAAPSPAQIEKRATNFQFFGVSESGAEFGAGIFPGVKGTDYTWPNTAAIDTLIGNGMNTFRVAFSMEHLIPNQLTGSLDSAYFTDLKNTVDHITGKGAYAVLDPHNYLRYYGKVITDVSAFQTWWKTVATQFAGNSKVIFDCNNEPHDMPSIDLVVQLNQACINGIRAAGATSQYIFVEGNSWSGAWTWVSAGNSALAALTDPQNKIIYEMHQYLDSDGSGTSVNCLSNTIGAERLAAATAWLKANNKKGIIGEFAGGANTQCKNAIEGMLAHLAQNSDVWTGALWWAAGTWWADYIYSYEPSSGTGYTYYKNTLGQYAGNGQSSKPTTSSVNTSPTSTKSAPPASTSAAGGGGSGGTVAKWGQCAGVGYTGPTVCVSGSKCTFNNEWYSQCL